MGLFKPGKGDAYAIESGVSQVKILYKSVFKTQSVETYIEEMRELEQELNQLLHYYHRFPRVFKRGQTPKDIFDTIDKEREEREKKLVDRWLRYLERKLLDYKTDKGKKNNFDKEYGIFKYYDKEFLPATREYRDKKIKKKYPEWV